ncbi:helix-turn-helix domain-containing protein [Micromonospora sp. NBC_01699]|uniref:helix-turn-helix domain-containing protein n=1 Tax=Micromonospora sp. NBC_01699 TaxID=2975984 RepID=UPI002E33FD56|nr:helix-turn-helix transcriptional regulator [Micromonospora sp. NBC_01699]
MSLSPYEFLLRELRQARIDAGLTQEALGERIHFSAQKVSAVETGRAPLTSEFVQLVDDAVGARGRLVRMWDDFVKDGAAPNWLLEWIEFERTATLLRWFEPSLVPGLLQTEAYARAVLSVGGRYSEQKIGQLLASRMERQAILHREQPPKLVAVIDAMVLRRAVGPAAVMMEQFEHLCQMASMSHIHLHVIPETVGMHEGLAGGFILAKGPEGEAAHLDNPVRAHVTDRAADLDMLQDRWESIRSDAAPSRETVDLIQEVAKTWT